MRPRSNVSGALSIVLCAGTALAAAGGCGELDPSLDPSGEELPEVTGELAAPVPTTVGEYKLPAYRDPEVLPSADIELWAALHRPATLTGSTRYPLIVFVHGNHGTCRSTTSGFETNEYGDTGVCPAGTEIIPNHRGYDYIASEIAARGYFVLSVNANRGVHRSTITEGDPSHIRARGRLLLRHLEKLTAWHRGIEATPAGIGVSLQNRIDFTQAGLMGHSQGGEAVLLAYNEYRAAGSPWVGRIGTSTARLNIRGIFAIGPTDGKATDLVLNADGTRWAALIPGCDMDVAHYDGINVYNRMMKIQDPSPVYKATYQVYGANHNFYNTEWRIGDFHPAGCINQVRLFDNPPLQRESGRLAAYSFFTANVGAARDVAGNRVFDPRFPLSVSGYRVHRGYHTGGSTTYSLPLNDFNGASGTSVQTGGGVTADGTSDGLMAIVHDPTPSSASYFQANFRSTGGVNLSNHAFVDFRIDVLNNDPNDFTPRSVSVQLVGSTGSLSTAVSLAPYVELVPPPRNVPVFQTARIPLTRFSGVNRSSIRGIRFLLSDPLIQNLAIANIRATRNTSGL